MVSQIPVSAPSAVLPVATQPDRSGILGGEIAACLFDDDGVAHAAYP